MIHLAVSSSPFSLKVSGVRTMKSEMCVAGLLSRNTSLQQFPVPCSHAACI